MSAIGLRFVPFDEKKHAKNHFFGAPILTPALAEEFPLEVLFLGMIHLPDIAKFDKKNQLPHTGYLYFFLDTSASYRQMKAIVRHIEEEPTICVDDFNDVLSLEEYSGANVPHGIEFYEVEDNAEGYKLLGIPCDWNYQENPGEILLTLSHFDEELNFLPQLDGFTYIFFGKGKERFEGATLFGEYA